MLLLIPADLSIFETGMTADSLHRAVLLLGSNQGDKARNLEEAIQLIVVNIGNVVLRSSVYETEPWGFESRDAFLNQALVVDTGLEPAKVMEAILGIEKQMGRERIVNIYSSRLIDIDILFYDQQIIEGPDLMVPHPLMQSRKFVLAPLNEIIPEFKHPVSGKKISQMLDQCEDTLKVRIAP